MPEEAVNGFTYNSVYRHSVDDKRRVSVPFRWRPNEAIEFTIVIWPKHRAGTCLLVMPPTQWIKLRAEIDAMASSDPKKSLLKRSIGTMSIQAKLDGSGRIAIPEEMATAAGIKGEAVLAGVIERFEIWSPERYAQVEALDKADLPQALQLIE
jgi:MraZ protein